MIRSLQKVLSSDVRSSRFGPVGGGGRDGGAPCQTGVLERSRDGIFRLMVLRDLCIDSNESGCVGMLTLR